MFGRALCSPELLVYRVRLMDLMDICIACLARPNGVGRTFQLTTKRGTFTVIECKACVERYQRAERMSHIKDSPERREWFGYMPLLISNLTKLTEAVPPADPHTF